MDSFKNIIETSTLVDFLKEVEKMVQDRIKILNDEMEKKKLEIFYDDSVSQEEKHKKFYNMVWGIVEKFEDNDDFNKDLVEKLAKVPNAELYIFQPTRIDILEYWEECKSLIQNIKVVLGHPKQRKFLNVLINDEQFNCFKK